MLVFLLQDPRFITRPQQPPPCLVLPCAVSPAPHAVWPNLVLEQLVMSSRNPVLWMDRPGMDNGLHRDPASASYPGCAEVLPERMRKFVSPLPRRRKPCPDNQAIFQALSSPPVLALHHDFGRTPACQGLWQRMLCPWAAACSAKPRSAFQEPQRALSR